MSDPVERRRLDAEIEKINAYARRAEDAAFRNLRTALLRQQEIETTPDAVRRARGNRG